MTPATETEEASPVLGRTSPRNGKIALRNRTRVGRSLLLLGILAVLLVAMTGCGINSLIGDGIPPGKSKVVGRVLVADNPQQALANLSVTVISTPTGLPTVSYRVKTDAQGLFSVDGIVTGKHLTNGPLSVSNVVVSVDPGQEPYQGQRVSLLLTEKRATDVILALPPTGFDATQVGSVSITSPAANSSGVTSGNSFQFVARLLDHDKNLLVSARTGNYLVPNLVLDGLMVTGIGADGTFEAVGSQIGVSSITGQVNVPGAAQDITSPRLDLPVQSSSTNGGNTTDTTTQPVLSPPAPPH